MLRFAGATENISSLDDPKHGDISSFMGQYSAGECIFTVTQWHICHLGGGKLRRLLSPNSVQDFVYIQPCGLFSTMEKVGNFFMKRFALYEDEAAFIIYRNGLEITTAKHYQYRIEPMKVDTMDRHYEGFKFGTLPPPGLPIVYHNQIIGRMPEDAIVPQPIYDDSDKY